MSSIKRSSLRKRLHEALRRLLMRLPKRYRFAFYRRLVYCDPAPDPRLRLKIAESREELEDCFKLLHDAYVAAGFMKPDPSGLRVTDYHALPSTTTLCAKFDGRVVGTISLIREGVFGFPMQQAFDIEAVRARGGLIAEVSALAVHPDFRKTGGAILFPLMKFMHDYCANYFDTRHMVIAVNPDKIELYEALLTFERLQERVIDKYDFANGAPAVGAVIDLSEGSTRLKAAYGNRPAVRNLHTYFYAIKLENIERPARRYFTTNDPVMTPELLDYFFNVRTQGFERMDDRKRALLWSIYNQFEYRSVLPMIGSRESQFSHPLRRHQRFSIKCPAEILIVEADGNRSFELQVIEISASGFQAESQADLPQQVFGRVRVKLGSREVSEFEAMAVRRKQTEDGLFFGFKIDEPDPTWRAALSAFEMGQTFKDIA